MPRPKLPPRFALASMHVLLNPDVSHAEFRFYTLLRALSWGKDSLQVPLKDLVDLSGYKPASVYAHARALRDHNALLWHCAEDVFECVFTKAGQSDKFFLPVSGDLESLISSPSLKDSKRGRINSDSRSPRIEPKATLAQVLEAHVQLLGYRPAHYAKGETKAAKWIGDHYTVADLEAAYRYYKAQPFWHDKPLTLRQLQTLLPEYLASQGVSHATSLQPDDPGQLERDLQLKAERSERSERPPVG